MEKRFTFTTAQILQRGIVLFCALFTIPVFGLSQSTGPNGSNVQAVHQQGFTGQGIGIGLISQDNTRYTHEAFFDKDSQGLPIGISHAHRYDATDVNVYSPSSHDTSVAGIACGRGGAAFPQDRGRGNLPRDCGSPRRFCAAGIV